MRDYKERNPSPQNDSRGCMCKDGKYSRKCCDGSFQAQGIGNITGHSLDDTNHYKVQRCGHNMKKEVHLHNRTLVVGNVYYLNFENTGHSNCYTVLSTISSGDHHIESETVYADCDACIAAN